MTGSLVLNRVRKQARGAFKAGLYEEAVAHYVRLLTSPQGGDASGAAASLQDHSEFAVALFRSGRYAEAARELEEIVKEQPDSASSYHKLGVVSMRLGKPQRALDAFRIAARLEPQEPAYQWSYAELALTLGEREEAEAAIDASLAADPNNEEAKAAKSALAARPEAFREVKAHKAVADEEFAGLVEFIKSRPVEDAPTAHSIDTGYGTLIGVGLGSVVFLIAYLYVRVVMIG